MWRKWFKRKENLAAIGLTLLVLGLHFIIINNPHKGRTLDSQGNVVEATGFNPAYHYEGEILDEQHYVTEANSIIHDHQLLHPEHPSLGKLLISAGIRLFGDNAFGWRFFSVLFGTISVLLFYLICQKLTARREIPLLATCLFAFENSVFIQASVAMLDVFLVTFMLAAFLLYLHSRYYSAGIALALASLVKFSAASAGAVIVLHWVLTRRKRKLDGLKFIIAAPLAFLALMPLADWIATGHLMYPWDRIHDMVTTMSGLTFHDYHPGNASRPWTWVTSPHAMAFWYAPSYYSGVNWTLWALIIPSMLYAIYEAIKRNWLLLFAVLWFASTYLVWFPVYFLTDRFMFRFYFYPTVGAICLAVAWGISQLVSTAARGLRIRLRFDRNRSAIIAIGWPPVKRRRALVFFGLIALLTVWMIANLVVFIFMGPLL